jgi:hypothetical protein
MNTPLNGGTTERRPAMPAQRARQGATGHNVRYVLAFSLIGAIIALSVIYLIYFV